MKLLGANWRTSVSGLIGVTAVTIASQPNLVSFLPDKISAYVRGFAGLIAAVAAAIFVLNAKDKQVTGGTVQQTASGDVAVGMSKSLIDTHGAQSAWEGLN